MFDLPSVEGVKEVMISRQVVDGSAGPLYMYATRAGGEGDLSAYAGWTNDRHSAIGREAAVGGRRDRP